MKIRLVILFLFTLVSTFSFAKKKVISMANSINVASQLFERNSEDDAIQYCEYYSLERQPNMNEYVVFLNEDNSKLLFNGNFDLPSNNTIAVQVFTKNNLKEVEEHLAALGFKKDSNGFYKKNLLRKNITRCIIKGKKDVELKFFEEALPTD